MEWYAKTTFAKYLETVEQYKAKHNLNSNFEESANQTKGG